MDSQNKCKKLSKKLKKFQQVVYKQTAVPCTTQPTKNIVICNAGLVNGLSEETIFEHFIKYGELENILLLPGISCSFIGYKDIASSQKAYDDYNGKLMIAQNGHPIYLLFCENFPVSFHETKIWNELPHGLIIIEDFVTPEEEQKMVQLCNFSENEINLGQMKHRQVKHFGYEFKYDTNNINRNEPLEMKVPEYCSDLFKRLEGTSFCNFNPDQLTVNYYKPGQGIPPHIDTHSAFEDPIMSLSLLSSVIMEFKKDLKTLCVQLPRRSLTIMSGESRYAWTHGITPRKFDIIATKNGLTTSFRGERMSLTFRKILHNPCSCCYKSNCDAFLKKNEIDQVIASKLEKSHVYDVYDSIASHFSNTRSKKWPKVWEFVECLPVGSILIDIGCGNGKYLSKSEKMFKIGCDTSFGLLNICKERKFEVFSANCLSLPLRDNIVDGVICIAVIHHLSREERRLRALKEIVRVLKSGGSALIYVWAQDQFKDKQKTSYIKQNRNQRKTEDIDNDTNSEYENVSVADSVLLPIHINRTQFKHKDVLVPWKLKSDECDKSSNTFLRYYHVFDEHEIEKLCSQINNIVILQSYYDQGNWCIVIKKN